MAQGLLYYITDRSAFSGDERARRKQLLGKIAEAATHGVDYIQLREKDLSARELESLAREVVTVIREVKARNAAIRSALLINSRTDVALAVDADGIQLSSVDISPDSIRRILDRGVLERADLSKQPLIGVSCHSVQEVREAANQHATFAVFAPVFEKKGARPSGLEGLHQACRADIPVLALGGVTLENAKSCLEAGAAGIAAIRMFQENDIATVVRQLRALATD